MERVIQKIFSFRNYKIAIIEDKEPFKPITEEIILSRKIDTRFLIAIGKNDSDPIDGIEYDYEIVVYDYDEFNRNIENEINRGLLYHEFGHIYYPQNGNIEQEIRCDLFAAKLVGHQAIHAALNFAIQEMTKLDDMFEFNELYIRKKIIESQ